MAAPGESMSPTAFLAEQAGNAQGATAYIHCASDCRGVAPKWVAGLHLLTVRQKSAERSLRYPERPLAYTLASGTFGTVVRDPPPPPPPLGAGGRGRRGGGGRRLALARRGSGSFSGFGVTGPSRYSKPSLSWPSSPLTTITRTWPPPLSLPNSTSSASGFLMCSWIMRLIGRAPICSS